MANNTESDKHCDLIYGVKNLQGWGNVMYIPAVPGCENNRRYAQQCAENFKKGHSPDDFPEEHYEVNWQGRFQWEELSELCKEGFGY